MIVFSTLTLSDRFPRGMITRRFVDANVNESEIRAIFPLPAAQVGAVADGYHPPILYLDRKPRETFEYVWDDATSTLSYQARQGIEQRVVKLYVPTDSTRQVLAIGGKKNDVLNAMFLLQAALGASVEMPHYHLCNYDLERLAASYPDDHWFLEFKAAAGHVSGGKIYGVGIEKSPLYAHAKVGSSSNEVGIVFQATGAALKVRVLRNGKVQFMQFTDEHLLTNSHPDLGAVWPMIVQVLQTIIKVA